MKLAKQSCVVYENFPCAQWPQSAVQIRLKRILVQRLIARLLERRKRLHTKPKSSNLEAFFLSLNKEIIVFCYCCKYLMSSLEYQRTFWFIEEETFTWEDFKGFSWGYYGRIEGQMMQLQRLQ